MRFGVHFGCWGEDYNPSVLADVLRQAKSIGAETFEVLPPDAVLHNHTNAILEMKKIVEDSGLELLFAFRYPDDCDMASEDPQKRRNAVSYLTRALKGIGKIGGKELGGILYAKWPACFDKAVFSKKDKHEGTQRSLECMRQVVGVAEDYGIVLNFEVINRFEHYLLNTAAEGVAYCRQLESDNCKLILDTHHMSIEEDSLEGAIVSAQGYIGHFHMTEPNRKIPYHNERINWPKVGQVLRKTEYDGTVTIETFPVSLGAATHRVRIWRDLIEDSSLENRLALLQEGLIFIKKTVC